jgi:SAM-dependent methyltransferase
MINISITRSLESSAPEIPQCWLLEPGVTQRASNEHDDWNSYWEELRENQRLFHEQSDEYFRNLCAALGLDPRMRVLDFGCGFGHVAELLAPHVGELSLWDTSANMRRRARLNLAKQHNIRFLDFSDPNASNSGLRFDLILVNSVVQYMTPEQFSTWLLRWRNMLATSGRIVVSDLIPPNYPTIRDIVDLLRFSGRRGFLVRAVWQAFSEIWRYWGVRRARPLFRVGPEDLSQRGRDAGLTVSCLPTNLTHFKKRLTAVFAHAEAH